ncbi:MAG: DNA polymerase III subunit delta [bacterium]|nr:DNA polymerase III subunit delta [bacterium]
MILFLYGEDIWKKKQKIAQISEEFVKKVDPSKMNLVVIDVSDAQEESLRNKIKSSPFLARKRLVILKNCLTGATRKAIPEIVAEALKNVSDTTILVVSEDSEKPKKWKHTAAREAWEFLEKNAQTEEFKQQWGSAISMAIINQAKKRGLVIQKDAAELLSVFKEGDFEQIMIELDKLTAYKGSGTCTAQDVRDVCSSSSETSIFDFLDAVGNREYKKVILLAEKELEESEPLGLSSRVASHLRALLALMLKKDAAVTALKLHPFQVKKLYGQIRNWDAETLKRGLHELLLFEYGVKSGNISEPKASLISTLSKIVATRKNKNPA